MILNHLDNIIHPLPLRRPPRLLDNNRFAPGLPPRRFPRHAARSADLADFGAAGAGARALSARRAGPSSHDFFFGDDGAAPSPVHVEAGVEEPEEEKEAGDGAEDDAHDGAGRGAGVEVGVGGGDGDDGLAAEEFGDGLREWL